MTLFGKEKNYFEIAVLIFLLAWLAVFLLQKIDLATADLGRHLKNGELILGGNSELLKSNFYSYTYPAYPFLNHHWASGVIFFLLWQIGGFAGLHLFSIILSLMTFFLFFQIAKRKAGMTIASALALVIIPLLSQRAEVRPEVFTYFFVAVFFWILWNRKERLVSPRWLLLLVLLQAFWVNLHIYFFLGPLIIGAFYLEEIMLHFKARKTLPRELFLVLILSLLATFFNPFGSKGALHPFRVYQNYGYRVLEEQPVWFLEKLGMINPNFLLFKIVFLVLVLSFVLAFKKDRSSFAWANFFLAAGVSIMAWLAIRNFALFGLLALPILAHNAQIIFAEKNKLKSEDDWVKIVLWGLAVFVISLAIPSLEGKRFGLGLQRENGAAAQFFKAEGLRGPIFNNYDIGGYLIYHLYPQERVFVDNRPEVYPASFFQKVYIPLQENNEVWKEQAQWYNFNVVFFSHRDATPWGQKFLIERIQDENWAPVFADNFAIILVKRNESNQAIINRYEIPRGYFRVTK